MNDVLAMVPLIGRWVTFEGPFGEHHEGVVDSVSIGVLVAFHDGRCIQVFNPDDWVIGVYRQAPGKIPFPEDTGG